MSTLGTIAITVAVAYTGLSLGMWLSEQLDKATGTETIVRTPIEAFEYLLGCDVQDLIGASVLISNDVAEAFNIKDKIKKQCRFICSNI